jgi:hypothetical protein
MISSLPASVDAGQVLAAGATAIRDLFPADVVPEILDAYLQGLRLAFAIGIGGIGMAALTAPLGRWNKLDMTKAAGGGAA